MFEVVEVKTQDMSMCQRVPDEYSVGDNPVNTVSIYTGSLHNLRKASSELFDWNVIDAEYDAKEIMLGDIATRLLAIDSTVRIITVFEQKPLYTDVFQYGNYGSYWVYMGEVAGYA